MAGHSFAVNANLQRKSGNPSTYEQTLGLDLPKPFIFGQLCFYKPAPTVWNIAEKDPSLRVGVFLD